jgi:hypothetical protein
MKRLLITFISVAGLLIAGLAPANASALFTYTDLSSQLTERNNRPVWAMDYSNGNWFYTDGQDLWNGGQVYRNNGYSQTNVTADIRYAGLSRVDEIVGDGSNILFFKNIFRLDNAVEGVIYQNGAYNNITSVLRQPLESNEGISSIVGRNGTWIMVTTRARIFSFTGNFSSYSRITTPSDMRQLSSSDSSLLYSVHHRLDRSDAGIVLAPAGNSFLLGVNSSFQNYYLGRPIYYRYDGNEFTKISEPQSDYSRIKAIAYNPSSAMILTDNGNGGYNNVYGYNGLNWEKIGGWNGTANYTYGSFADASNFKITWDGYQWVIISGKQIYRMMNGTIEKGDATHDYFVTAASDKSGNTFFGGAESADWLTGTSIPLTAKLVRAANTLFIAQTVTSNYPYGDRVYTSSNGPRLVTRGTPNTFMVKSGNEFNYQADATDSNGIDRIEIFANGARVKTCSSNYCEFRTTYYASGYNNRTAQFSARALDRSGYWTDSATETLTVYDAVTPPNTVYIPQVTLASQSRPPATWSWVLPGNTSVLDGVISYHVGAWDNDGIAQIEIRVNGSVQRNCYFQNAQGNVECAIDLSSTDYQTGTNITVTSRAIDAYGAASWSDTRTLYVVNGSTNSSVNLSGWINVYSNRDGGYYSYDPITYTANAYDENGISRIEIYVFGSLMHVCTDTSSCSWTENANPNRSYVSYGAYLVDKAGFKTWTGYKTIKKY